MTRVEAGMETVIGDPLAVPERSLELGEESLMSQSMGESILFLRVQREACGGLKRHLKEFFHHWVENHSKRSSMEVKRQTYNVVVPMEDGWSV